MKIHRLRVLIAKGWYKVLCFVSFSLLSVIGNHALAQKAGDVIRGVVSDDEGPMIQAIVVEKNRAGAIVAATTTDLEGQFSLKLQNSSDRIVFTYVGYQTVELPIDTLYFDVRMKVAGPIKVDDIEGAKTVDEVLKGRPASTDILFKTGDLAYGPPVSSLMDGLDNENNNAVITFDDFESLDATVYDNNLQAYGTAIPGLDIVFNSKDLEKRAANRKPLLVMDDNIIPRDTTVWKGIDHKKENYSKSELARLFGIRRGEIKTVKVLRGLDATTQWGRKGESGVIEIITRRYYRENKDFIQNRENK